MAYKVTYQDGKIEYRVSETDATIHRETSEGPAIIFPNGEEWFVENGKLHNENGPAIVRTVGISEYWRNGVQVDASEALVKPRKPAAEPAPKTQASPKAPKKPTK